MKEKVIFHMDGDAFFVACEVAKNPSLKGRPVVTGEERGIVSALSYEAKALGITRGMPIFKLKKDFPSVLVLAGDYKTYAKFSKEMFEIVRRYTDIVEEYSIDECFADLTGYDVPFKMTYKEIAEKIKKEVTAELGLSVSVGLAPTKVLSKVASKFQKPNGLTEINRETIKEFLHLTPIEKIWGIGSRTARFLKTENIQTALNFIEKDLGWVRENMNEPFEVLWQELSGNSLMTIHESRDTYKSIQKTRTFYPPSNNPEFLLSQLSKHIEEACRKARHHKLVPQKIHFFLKTQDFRYFSYEINLNIPTNSPETLMSEVRKYFKKVYFKTGIYRSSGVTIFNLVPEPLKQQDLFSEGEITEKFEKIHEQVDSLEEKFGKGLVYLASSHRARQRKVKGTDADDLDRNLLFL